MPLETILVVDDEIAVLKYVEVMLTRVGYQIVPAGSASDALRLFRIEGAKIQLMITDIQMPGMNGRELARTASRHYPTVPVVFMTAYSLVDEQVDTEKAQRRLDGHCLVRKPFSPDKLIAVIQSVLSSDKRAYTNP